MGIRNTLDDGNGVDTGFEPEMNRGDSAEITSQNSFDEDSIFDDQNINLVNQIDTSLSLPYNPSGTNDALTVFLIVNAALGGALLNVPKAFDDAGGIAVAISVQLFLIVPIVIALNILAYAADRSSVSPASTIQDVVGQTTGTIGRILTSLAVVLYCFGTTVTFLVRTYSVYLKFVI